MPSDESAGRETDILTEIKGKLHLSGSTLSTILQLTEDIVVVVDKNGTIIEASKKAEKIFGVSLKDIIGKVSWENFIPDEEIKRLTGYFIDRAKGTGNPPSTYTLRVKVKEDISRFMRVNVGFVPGTENRVVILKDLSQLVLEQKKTAETEEKYRTVVENTKDGILICTEDRILFTNNSFCSMTDLSREEVYTFSPIDFFHKEDRNKMESLCLNSGNKNKGTAVFEARIKKGKRFLPAELSSAPMVYRNTEAILISVRDLTQRKDTEKKLRESHKLMKAIVDNSPIGISVHDRNGTLLMANASWRNIWNKSVEDMKEKMVLRAELRMDKKDSYLGKYIDDVEAVYRKGGELYIPKLMIPNPSPGGAEYISHHFYALKDDNGEVDKVVILTLDLTESLKTKVELMETRNQYRELTENIPVAIYRTTTESGGRIVYSNPEMHRMFLEDEACNFNEVSARDLYVDPFGRKEFLERLADNNEVRGFETELKRQDGSTFLASISARKVTARDGQEEYIEGIISDITDQRRLEEELQRIEHLESIGTLAGGIAHDFNNLLMAIQGNISLARNEEDLSKLSMRLEHAEASTEEATILTRQLLTFARGGVQLKESVDVASFIREAVIFTLRGSDVEAVFNFDEDLRMIEADREQIAQVINNITSNSVHAMISGGRITVSCTNVELEENSDIHLKAGEYVRISIKDTGKGIHPDDLKKIFNPYFTTKPDGSGLGLPTSYSIVSRHSGTIRVYSEIDKGTEFVIYLPAIVRDGKKTVCEDDSEQEIHSIPSNVLIMDDDPRVREVLSGMLDILGHYVTESADGSEAVDLYRERFSSGEPFDVVIMDLTVPGGMGGEAAIKMMKEIDPDIRAIVSSGYANNTVLSNFTDYGFSGRLIKPFKISSLKKELNTVLTLA
ncbi:MAG: PAS domain S-box protein [Candidatus Aegiribacteria sp.]|nr:PAS domain S-box protein [Candidatus Aegiribacteria sp.]